uniref:TNFR-Cys domain-containing protein n=1 Tax=Kryptolebias marmoratus TaxID=37003 RepID=A0A3Q2ZEK8_KRYMA
WLLNLCCRHLFFCSFISLPPLSVVSVNPHSVHLFQDCGFGYGGEGVCVACGEGTFSTETGVAPCRRCTQCNLLNRLMETACSPTGDRLCGRCLPGLVPAKLQE